MAASARSDDGGVEEEEEEAPNAGPPLVLMEALALASGSGGNTHRSEFLHCIMTRRPRGAGARAGTDMLRAMLSLSTCAGMHAETASPRARAIPRSPLLLPLACVLASPTARSGSTGTASSSASSSRLSLGGAPAPDGARGGSAGGVPALSVVDIIKVLGSDDAGAAGARGTQAVPAEARLPSRR